MSEWDLVVVGAGPAGAAAAVGALRTRPELSVLLLDRADFPRDKACGDGIAPHAIDLLARFGVTGVVDDQVPLHRLRLERRDLSVARNMERATWVVPRTVFDARLVRAAVDAGAVLRRHRVRDVRPGPEGVAVDGIDAAVVVGADGDRSLVARAVGAPSPRSALAIRGYAPTPAGRRGEQVIAFGDTRQPSYAWSFDRGDGWANVGYGELLTPARSTPSRRLLLEQLDRLLPGATADSHSWRGHHLPLAGRRWRPGPGRVLLAGDAAALINPMTGEGIYYAVLTGLEAGVAAAEAVADRRPGTAGSRYRAAVGPRLDRHLAHTAFAHRMTSVGPVLTAGLRAAARDQRAFDAFVDLGLADGTLTPRLLASLAVGMVPPRVGSRLRGTFK